MIMYWTIPTYANDWHNHRRDRDRGCCLSSRVYRPRARCWPGKSISRFSSTLWSGQCADKEARLRCSGRRVFWREELELQRGYMKSEALVKGNKLKRLASLIWLLIDLGFFSSLVTSSLIRKTSYSTRQQLFNRNQKAWIIKRTYSNEALHPSLDDSSWVDYWIRNIELPGEGEKPGIGSRLLWSPQNSDL